MKLKNYKINDDFLCVNDKIVIFENNLLQINVIKIYYDKFITEYLNRIDIFANVSQYY